MQEEGRGGYGKYGRGMGMVGEGVGEMEEIEYPKK